MKTEEDEAFDELARKQGMWGGGFKAKQAMAADKLQEPVCDKDPQGCWNVRCQLGKQCKNLAQPAQEPDWKTMPPKDAPLVQWVKEQTALPLPAQEPVAWALEWTFDGEEKGRRLYDDERHCKLDAENDGGICRPLVYGYTTPPQPVQEPVACARCKDLEEQAYDLLGQLKAANLKWSVAHPWVGLTTEDFSAIKFPAEMLFPPEFRAGARWAEAKLKERNHGT